MIAFATAVGVSVAGNLIAGKTYVARRCQNPGDTSTTCVELVLADAEAGAEHGLRQARGNVDNPVSNAMLGHNRGKNLGKCRGAPGRGKMHRWR